MLFIFQVELHPLRLVAAFHLLVQNLQVGKIDFVVNFQACSLAVVSRLIRSILRSSCWLLLIVAIIGSVRVVMKIIWYMDKRGAREVHIPCPAGVLVGSGSNVKETID
jgi:hypothetical protein